MPQLTVRKDDSLLLAEADYQVSGTFRKYATGEWPCGEYEEEYEWGKIKVRITPYRDLPDVQSVEVAASIIGSHKQISIKQLIECRE